MAQNISREEKLLLIIVAKRFSKEKGKNENDLQIYGS